MNMFKKGPEIKLSDLKVPDFLLDLYYDLRERHLLPLVAILAIAIVAVPVALSQSSGSEASEEESAAGSTAAIASAVDTHSGVLVAKSAPGLREFDRRLRRLNAKDPFKQQTAGEGESSSATTAGETEAAPGESTNSTGFSSESPPEAPVPSSTPSESSGEPTPGPGNLTYFSYAIDVRVVTGSAQDSGSSSNSSGNSSVRRNLPELTMLPSRDTPAAVYMGSTKDGKKALMLISSDVQAIFGDGKCVLGSDSCELLAMEPGVPETFVYGGAGRTFKIELQKIHLVTTDKLNRAPLGKPKKGKSSKGGQFRQQ
jgi:hypothetical protein